MPHPGKIITCTLFLFASISHVKSQDMVADEHIKQAEAFKKNGNSDSALVYYEKASAEYQQSGNTEGFVNACNQAGIILTRQDKYEKAKTYLNNALSKNKLFSDSNHLLIATTYLNLGVVFSAEENYGQSLLFHKKALDIRLLKLGIYHADVATSYGNIGNVYLRSKDYDKALENHLQAMKIREKVFGNTGVEVVQSYNNLGNVYKERKEYKTSLEYYEKALQNKIAQLGEKHKDLARYYKSISDIYFLMGNKEQAEFYKVKSNEN